MEQGVVDHAEDHRHCPDSEGEGQHRHYGECRRVPKLAQTIAQVLTQTFEGGPSHIALFLSSISAAFPNRRSAT
jgi:hypothetical protein